jgi:hypothetical protein
MTWEMKMRNSKPQTTMKSILKVKTKSFLENYRENRMKDMLVEDINIIDDDENKIKELIKEGTLTDKLLIEAIKNVMKERIKK